MPQDRRANIGTGIWSERSMRALTWRQRDAYLLVYTQPDVNRCGVLPYRLRYLAGLATDTTQEDLSVTYRELAVSRHVILDEADEQLLIRTYVKHDGLLSQPLVVASMIRDFHKITSPVIRTAFLAELRRLWDDPTLEPKYHPGLELALGARPTDLGIKNADKVATAIGAGLLGPLIDAIATGDVPPYTAKGLPKGLTEGQLEGLTKGPPEGQAGGQGDPRYNARAPVPAPVPATAPATVTASHPPPDTADPTATLLAEHATALNHTLPPSSLAPIRTAIARLVAERTEPALIRDALTRMRSKRLGPALLPQLVAEAAAARTPRSTTDDRVAQAQAVANRYRETEQRGIGA